MGQDAWGISMLGRLQGLRAIAAYMVVIYHSFEFLHSTGLGIPQIPVGASGVDLFFAISGFIMVYVSSERDTAASFALGRLARIVPLYWLATFAAMGLIAVRPWLFPASHITPESVIASLTFVPAQNADGRLAPILLVGWTLNFEMMFYALLSTSMTARKSVRRPFLLVMMAAVFVIGLLAPKGSFASFYANPIILEFGFGMAIAAIVRRKRASALVRLIPSIVFIAAGVAGLGLSTLLTVDDWIRPLVWGFPAALVVLGVVQLDIARPSAKNSRLGAMGDASYSAYLLHPFVLTLLGGFAFNALGAGYQAAVSVLALTLAITAVVSTLSYTFIEVPARNLVRRALLEIDRKRPAAAAPAS